MRKTFKGLLSVAIIGICALNTTSCSNKKFNVEGQISNAADSVLYFENVGLEGISIIDSVKLSDKGDFSFSEEAPTAPEFYRLRISDQIINVSIDSTETVTIKAQSADIRKNVKEQFTALSDNVQKLVTTLNDLYGTSIGSVNNARDLIDDGLALVEDQPEA